MELHAVVGVLNMFEITVDKITSPHTIFT